MTGEHLGAKQLPRSLQKAEVQKTVAFWDFFLWRLYASTSGEFIAVLDSLSADFYWHGTWVEIPEPWRSD
jgi:hypothetical protein